MTNLVNNETYGTILNNNPPLAGGPGGPTTASAPPLPPRNLGRLPRPGWASLGSMGLSVDQSGLYGCLYFCLWMWSVDVSGVYGCVWGLWKEVTGSQLAVEVLRFTHVGLSS